jgi:putative membrane protein
VQPSTDRKFVQDTALGGLEEIALGKLAAQKAASDQVRRLGQRMADDQGQASEVLKVLAQAKGVTLPASLDAKQQKEIERLQKLSGADFDRAYMKLVVEDHQKDIREFRKQAQRGVDAEIKSFAATTLPKLHDHLAMARDAVRTAKFTDPVRKPSATAAVPADGEQATGTADGAATRTQSR